MLTVKTMKQILLNLSFIIFMLLLVGGVIVSIAKWLIDIFKPKRDWLTSWRAEHAIYLQTPHWKAVSLAIRKKKGVCQVKGCNERRLWKLNAHHKHYKTKWRERDEDLEVLCSAKHHPATHRGVPLMLKDGSWLRPFDGKE